VSKVSLAHFETTFFYFEKRQSFPEKNHLKLVGVLERIG
jgi:hypothetical protein